MKYTPAFATMACQPHGGFLKDLLVRDADIKQQLIRESRTLKDIVLTEVKWPSITSYRSSCRQLTFTSSQRQLCDLELICNGGFSPLEGFMNQADYLSVLSTLRLTSGFLFPIPITLDVSSSDIESLSLAAGSRIALRDPRDEACLAILTVEDIYKHDKKEEAEKVYGADDIAHPSVAYSRSMVKEYFVGGKVQAVQAPQYFDYVALRCEWSIVMLCFPPRKEANIYQLDDSFPPQPVQ